MMDRTTNLLFLFFFIKGLESLVSVVVVLRVGAKPNTSAGVFGDCLTGFGFMKVVVGVGEGCGYGYFSDGYFGATW